ncbi:19824_t:CDS:2, partial [Racocetra persica]
MEIKQKGSRSCRVDQGNVANPEQHFLQDSASKISRTDKSSQLITANQKSSPDTRQKVPNTSKYQLNIRKNQQCSVDNPTSSPLPTVNGGLLEITFDQSKGQLLWAPEGYQGVIINYIFNSKKRRLNGGSLTSSKSYVPRPPNAFIIYHKTKSKELAKIKSRARSASDERHPSKTVGEMWKEESEEVKLRYQREADLALVEHKKKYPYYKYKPKKRDSKKCSLSPPSTDSARTSDSESKDDSQVPIEHRKQASMESAFSVYDLRSNHDQKEENDSNLANPMFKNKNSPPLTPDFPGEQVQLNYQSQCPNCSCGAHNRGPEQKLWPDYSLPQVSSATANLQPGLSIYPPDLDAILSLFNFTLEFVPPADSPITPTFSSTMNEPNFTNLENQQFSSNINGIIPTTADIITIPQMPSDEPTQSTTNWNNIPRYIIPPQSTTTIMPTSLPQPQAPPPTPTSPVEFLSWTPSLASLSNANINTNINTNIAINSSQIDNQQPNIQLPAQSNNH